MANIVLYDPTGTPVAMEQPENEPKSPPIFRTIPDGATVSVQDRYREHPSWGLTAGKLQTILTEADSGDPRRWVLLCEEILEKDPKVRSVAATRQRAVMGLYWDVNPCEVGEYATAEETAQSQEIARFCSRVLKESNFPDLLRNILTAISKPFAVSWITWYKDQQGSLVPRFSTIPATHIRWAYTSDEIVIVDPMAADKTQGTPVDMYATVRALYNPHEDHPSRAGLLRTVAYYELFKAVAIKDLNAYCERFGMPLRLLRLDDVYFKDEDYRELLRQALRNLGTDGSAVFSKNADIEIKEAARSGVGPYSGLIDYCDKAVAQLYLGHELSSQSSPGTGQLGITAAMEVYQGVVQDDCQWVSQIIKRDVLRPIVGFNIGWDQARFTPDLYFDFEPEIDLLAAVQVDAAVRKTWPEISWSEQQVRDKYGVETPIDDEDTLAASAQPAAPQPGATTSEPFRSVPETIQPGRGFEVPTVQSRARLSSPRGPTKFKSSRQKRIDKLAQRTRQAAAQVMASWSGQLRSEVRRAARSGNWAEMRNAIVRSYPDLDTETLERVLGDAKILARLYGRNGK